ncbi:MAG TPA: histidine--tRNA ligase [Thermoplasmata archaeon]|nr:histidine--tRNA ligase [Thermoplasmata archaeon]
MQPDFRALRGFREFYPEQTAARRRVYGTAAAVAARFGYREVEFPSLESLELFEVKSGDEVVKQTFAFTDKGGRRVTLIPEATPSVARMVAQTAKTATLPMKWWSFRPYWRYEEPQSGREREFCQLNVDCFGSTETAADAEIVSIAVEVLRALRLDSSFLMRMSDRRVLDAALAKAGVQERKATVSKILDRRGKISDDDLRGQLREATGNEDAVAMLDSITKIKGPVTEAAAEAKAIVGPAPVFDQLDALSSLLEASGTLAPCVLDLSIVRGLDYYTGLVFEAFDSKGTITRSILGGGRYDDLVELFGGPKMPAVGFAMGDSVLEVLMRREGLWPSGEGALDYVVVPVGDGQRALASKIAVALRAAGRSAELDVMGRSLSKQMKYAASAGAARAIIVGPEEEASGDLTVRDLKSGEQTRQKLEGLVREPPR